MQLCVSVQIPVCFEGLQSEAIYVDTNSNFSQLRLTGRYNKNKLFLHVVIFNNYYFIIIFIKGSTHNIIDT